MLSLRHQYEEVDIASGAPLFFWVTIPLLTLTGLALSITVIRNVHSQDVIVAYAGGSSLMEL
jgi:hypothetical protein